MYVMYALVIVLPCYGTLEIVGVIIIIINNDFRNDLVVIAAV